MSQPALTTIDPILGIADICRLLKCSERQFHELTPRLREMGLLVPVLPSLDRRPRYQGAAFVSWLSDKRQQRELMALLTEAS
jgi:hypothetical protein